MAGDDPTDALVAGPPPAAGDLLAIPPDDWAWLIPHIRTALGTLEGAAVDDRVKRLRSSPASRLAGGRVRRELCGLLADGGPAWTALVRVLDDEAPPESLQFLAGAGELPEPVSAASPQGTDALTLEREREEAADRERQLRDRAKKLKEQRDEARRRAAGAESRAESLEASLAELQADHDRVSRRVDELRGELDDARAERERAVERERRRQDARVRELEEELRDVRRRQEQEREERARRRREAEAAATAAAREEEHRKRRTSAGTAKVRPGRPTKLPKHIAADTTQEADALLGPGRLVLIDGYNVTLKHRGDLSLEEQRTWLIRQLQSLARSRGVRPEVIFDGRDLGVAPRVAEGGREVTVRFSLEGVTADDEIEMAVVATDEPIVVVTDDRELRDRLRPHGVDLLRTATFVSLAT